MRAFLRILALRVSALLAVPVVVGALAAPALAQQEPTVVAIEFEGNRRYNAEVLRGTMATKVGKKFDRALLNQDINTLYKFFDTVDVQESTTAEGVRLLFRVSENPMVTAVVFSGRDQLSETRVKEAVDTKKGLPLANHRVQNDVLQLTQAYKAEGYHFVQVDVRAEDFADGKKVTFGIQEGPQVSVDTITFVGNDNLVADTLSDRMATQESGFLSPSYFVEETLRQDLLSVRNTYRSEGWLDAEVVLQDLPFSEERDEVTIVIGIVEGPAYKVGKVTITGAASYPGGEAALMAFVRLEAGTRRRQEELSDTVDAIEDAYRDQGFASVVVVPEESVPATGYVVDITLRIEERGKVTVRNVDILGNVVTKDKVIRREISLEPGSVLNTNEIRKSLDRIRSLGYFPRVSAHVRDLGEGEDPNKKDVVFEVDDTGRTGQVRFAVGFSTDLGALFTLAVTKRNFDWKDVPESFGDIFDGRAFTGGGQTFRLELSPGDDFSAYRIGFTEPWLFDKPISFGWDVFLEQFSRFDYDEDRKGVNFSLGRRWKYRGEKQDTTVGLTGVTRIENRDVSDIDRDSSPTAFLSEGDNSLLAQRFIVRVDRLDNTLEPTKGWFAQFSTEYGWGGDLELWKSELEGKHLWVLHRDDNERDHVFSLGARLGLVHQEGGSEKVAPNILGRSFVPIYEKYYAGGGGTGQSGALRGFAFGGAGPHGEGNPFTRPGTPRRARRAGRTILSILENDGDPMGGNVLFVSTAEYAFPIYENILRGVFFVDAGVVRDSFGRSHGLGAEAEAVRRSVAGGGSAIARQLRAEGPIDEGESFFSDLRVAVGFGVRIRIPVLGPVPVALDFGFPVSKESGDDTQVLSFSIARDF